MLSRRTWSTNIKLPRALFDFYNTQNYQVAFIQIVANPSDGSELLILLSMFFTDDEVNFYSFIVANICQSSGARTTLPMRVSPEAIVELYLFEYRLKVSSSATIIFDLHKIFFFF
jgi:hypothetical protein